MPVAGPRKFVEQRMTEPTAAPRALQREPLTFVSHDVTGSLLSVRVAVTWVIDQVGDCGRAAVLQRGLRRSVCDSRPRTGPYA